MVTKICCLHIYTVIPRMFHGLRWAAGYQDIVIYVDDGCITGSNPIWVQGMLLALVQYTNLGNTNSMT